MAEPLAEAANRLTRTIALRIILLDLLLLSFDVDDDSDALVQDLNRNDRPPGLFECWSLIKRMESPTAELVAFILANRGVRGLCYGGGGGGGQRRRGKTGLDRRAQVWQGKVRIKLRNTRYSR